MSELLETDFGAVFLSGCRGAVPKFLFPTLIIYSLLAMSPDLNSLPGPTMVFVAPIPRDSHEEEAE